MAGGLTIFLGFKLTFVASYIYKSTANLGDAIGIVRGVISPIFLVGLRKFFAQIQKGEYHFSCHYVPISA